LRRATLLPCSSRVLYRKTLARYRTTRHRPNPIRADIGELPQLFSTPRAINPKKYDDIMPLLDYVPPIHHMFFKNLVADEEYNVSVLPITN